MTNIVNGLPDFVRLSQFSRAIQTSRQELDRVSQEFVTGRVKDLVSSLGSRAGEYNTITKAIDDIDRAGSRLSITSNRLSQIDIALKSVRTTIGEFETRALVDTQINGEVGRSQTSATARSHLESVFTSLNSQQGGRALFAGDDVTGVALTDVETFLASVEAALGGATDQATIDTTITAFFADGGTFDTSIYTGGDGEAASVRLPDGAVVDYSIKADDPSIKTLVEGLTRLAFLPADVDTPYVENAATQIVSGKTGIASLQADVGRQTNLVSLAEGLAAEEKRLLQENENALVGIDPFEAASNVQRLEVQLQAAYQLTARLGRLSLLNVL